jgi:hypothetical protein
MASSAGPLSVACSADCASVASRLKVTRCSASNGARLAKNSSRFAGIASDRGGPARAPPQLTDRVALRQHSMIDRVIINHVQLNQPIRHCESGLPPTLSLVLELSEEELDALVHKATIDAYRRWAGHA